MDRPAQRADPCLAPPASNSLCLRCLLVCPPMQFALVFGAWYLSNRIMMVWVHRGTEGGAQELWRGSQMWVW